MHLPFNEGYVKSMRKAYPDDTIIFAASEGHVQNLKCNIESDYNIEFATLNDFDTELNGKSYHNPFYAIPAAKRSWRKIAQILSNKDVRNITLLGANGVLIHSFSKWGRKLNSASIHFVQHNQLSTAMKWRSKNLIYKYFDYLSVVNRGLPKQHKLILLELGLDDVLVKLAPKIAPSIVTIEHPVQEREYMPPKPVETGAPIKIGFLGNCGVGKGFDKFLKIASLFSGKKYQFYAIGKNNVEESKELSFDGLTVKPADGYLPREDFVRLLADIDIVCLPLPKTTSYVSSGSIIDAFAASKPLIISQNQSVRAIEDKYGEYGFTYNQEDELIKFLNEFSVEELAKKAPIWQEHIAEIQRCRS
ncbi:MAG: hypothetical protein CL811_00625, partial [Colwelliaceae bacterium]|nr:hypothetical protein [Colwelliaceae bacterium]